jgi:galactokinase
VDAASDLFVDRFGSDPLFTIRAPGRVNLMGDHTDYSMLPVLPVAIQRAVTIAAGPGPEGVAAVSDTQPGTALVRGGVATQTWGVYLAGVVTVLGELAAGRGACLAVSSDLASTGGLASSSALTMAALGALNRMWDLGIDRERLVDLATTAERQAGVESGGMDQTIIAFAEPGSALRISFEPLRRRPVRLPTGVSFVTGYSGTAAAKGADAKIHYNRSVMSCRAAALLLATSFGIEAGTPPVLRRVATASRSALGELPERVTPVEVAEMAGVDVELLTALSNGGFFSKHEHLFPRVAAQHGLAEAQRVDAAVNALGTADGAELGRIFDASHASLAEFGATTPQLDELTEAARAAGAWGARLTGAGFGGWAVAVCPPEAVPAVTEAMTLDGDTEAFAIEASGGMT